MRVLGRYLDKYCHQITDILSNPIGDDTLVALEISSAIIIHINNKVFTACDNNSFFIQILSDGYSFEIRHADGDSFDKDKANEIVRKIATEDIVILDDMHLGLFHGKDTEPDFYPVVNAGIYDDDGPIPLIVTKE